MQCSHWPLGGGGGRGLQGKPLRPACGSFLLHPGHSLRLSILSTFPVYALRWQNSPNPLPLPPPSLPQMVEYSLRTCPTAWRLILGCTGLHRESAHFLRQADEETQIDIYIQHLAATMKRRFQLHLALVQALLERPGKREKVGGEGVFQYI